MAKKAAPRRKLVKPQPKQKKAKSPNSQPRAANLLPRNAPEWFQQSKKPISSKLALALKDLGFRSLLQGIKRTSAQLLVRINNGVVSEVSHRDVKTALHGTLDAIPNCLRDAYEAVNHLTTADIARLTDLLPLLSLRTLSGATLFTPAIDTEHEASFFFDNGVVSVTKTDIRLLSYASASTTGLVWEHGVVNRSYAPPQTKTKGIYEQFVELSFYRKTRSGSARWTKDFEFTDDSKAHYNAFRGCLGYLLHSFRNDANSRAIIFVDADSDNTLAQGGTGKSLVARSLEHLRSLATQDGKRFADSMGGSGRFQFSNVTLDTKIVLIDDVRPEFKFEYLFTMLTGDMEVEQKGKDKLVIPKERVPKFVITTNYVLPQSGTSFQRRQYLVEFGSYWSTAARHGELVSDPQHLGKRLFDGFNDNDWNQFYSYLFGCVQQFLREGVTPPPTAPLQLRALRRELGDDFVNWCEDLFEKYTARKVPSDKGEFLDDLKSDFFSKHPTAPSIDSFPTHLMRAAEFFGWEYNRHKASMGTTPTARRWRITDFDGGKRDAVYFTKTNKPLPSAQAQPPTPSEVDTRQLTDEEAHARALSKFDDD